jgi:hypothetical protein
LLPIPAEVSPLTDEELLQKMGCITQGDFVQAARLAGELLLEHPGDGPLLLTLTRRGGLMRGGGFDPVWTLPEK